MIWKGYKYLIILCCLHVDINIVTFLVSAIHQHKSAIAIHMSPPSGTTLEAALWALALCMGAAQPS